MFFFVYRARLDAMGAAPVLARQFIETPPLCLVSHRVATCKTKRPLADQRMVVVACQVSVNDYGVSVGEVEHHCIVAVD